MKLRINSNFNFTLETENYKEFENNREAIKEYFFFNPEQKIWISKSKDTSKMLEFMQRLNKSTRLFIDPHTKKYITQFSLSCSIQPIAPAFAYMNNEYARDYQKAAVEYLVNAKKCFLCDEMGLGKTFETILAMNFIAKNFDNNLKALIVTPAHLKNTWISEFEQFTEVDTCIYLYNAYKDYTFTFDRNSNFKITAYIINYELLEKNLPYLEMKAPFDIVVFDESHYLKNLKAKRTKAAFAVIKNFKPQYIWLLTGTPLTKDAMDLYSQLKLIEHPLAQNYIYYAKRYADMKEIQIRGKRIKKFGVSNAEELKNILLSTCMIRRTKSQVLHELPEKIQQIIILDPSEVQNLILQEKEILKSQIVNPNTNIEFILEHPEKLPKLNLLSQIRQELALSKIPAIVSLSCDILQEQEKIVIFAWHKTVINALEKAFKQIYNDNEVCTLTGDNTQGEKSLIINKFQNYPNPRILICSIAAVATGITLTKASTCIFAELDWIPANIMQAEDRLHRLGQKNSVNIYYVVYDSSLESFVAKKMLKRKNKINKVLY